MESKDKRFVPYKRGHLVPLLSTVTDAFIPQLSRTKQIVDVVDKAIANAMKQGSSS